jgi:autotransporter-associated beta strand protein
MKLKKQNLLAIALLGFGTTALHAGQIWDGGSTGPGNDNWTTAANWDGAGGGVLPNFANAITFAGNTRNSPINDRTPDLTIGGINFTNDGSAGKTNAFTLSGARITLGGDITTTANTAGTTITDTISLNMILNGNRTILTSQQSASVQHNLEISGDISESGGSRNLAKNGAGMLILSGNNSYSGTTSIGTTGSILRIKSSTALGTTAGGVTLGANRALEIDGSGGALNVGAEAITVAGTGVSGGGAIRNIAGNNTWGGTVTLSGGTRIHSDSGTLLFNNATAFTTSSDRGLVIGGEGNVTISGAIATGAGTVLKDGNGTLTLSGNNSYTGGVTINGGTLVAAVSGSGGNSALGGSLSTKTINVNTGGTLRFDVGNVFNNNFASLASALPTLNIAGGVAS